MSYLQKLYKASKLVHSLIKVYAKKLFSSLESPTRFDESFKVTSVPFFIPSLNLLRCEIESFYIDIILKQNKLWNTFTILSQFIVKNLKWLLLLLQ